MNLKFLLFFNLICFSFYSQGVIDGFFKGKNNLDIALSYSYQKADTYFAGHKEIKYQRNLQAVGLFAEGGLTAKFDVIVNIPFINWLPQDAGIFGKYHLLHKQVKNTEIDLIGAAGITFPMFKYEVNSGQAIGQRATQILPKLVFQAKFGNGIFIQTQSGYNYAFSPVASSIPFSVKVGMARSKWYFDGWFDVQEGIGNKDYQGTVPYNSFRELVVSYQRFGGVIYYGLKPKLGVFINSAYTFTGRNTSKSLFIGTGLVVKLNKK